MRTSYLLSSFLLAASTLMAQDITRPTIARQTPVPGTVVRDLTEVEVVFSEAVDGIDAGDLTLNGVAATNVFGAVPGQYVWQFAQPATGVVSIAFISGHGITDQSPQANTFAGALWNVTFDPNATVYGVVISEIMAVNGNGIHDEDGDTSDWIELYNAGSEVVNLNGWFLTDDVLNPTKWRIPPATVAPNAYLLVWASEKDRTNSPLAFHTNFKLDNNGDYLALLDPNTNVVSAFAPSYPPQVADVSYGRDRLDQSLIGFYTTPTPRNHNTTTGAGVLPKVEFSRSSSTFVNPFQLSLSLANTNGEIRYMVVTNRFSATNLNFLSITNMRLYTGPITVESSWQVRARAFPKAGTGYFPGEFQTESYIQLNPNVLNFSSDLPLVIIHDFAAGPYDQTESQREETSVVAFFEPGTDGSSLTNHPVLVSRAGVNARGSSTLTYQKVSLAVELWSEANDDADKPVLGMKPESDWVFYAPNNFEPVLFHNPLYYQLSRDAGRWAPETRFAEVFLNTSTNAVATNHYNGIYVVTEKVKRSPSRLDIPRLQVEDTNAPAITGGYLLSIDRVDTAPGAGEATFATTSFGAGAPVNIQSYGLIYVDPSGRDGMNAGVAGPRDPQERYIANYINTMITNLASATFTNVPKIYEQHIDVDSWIDHIQIAMAAYNVDAVRLSGYLYKDRNKRLEFGPAWDCDRCMGSTDGRELQPRTWTGTGDRSDFFNPPGSLPNFWFQRLFRDLDFWQKYVDRYQELRAGPFHLTNIFARIDQNVALLTNAYPREFAKWRQAPRRASVTNANGTYTLTTAGATYATEVEWKKEWFSARFNFLDTNLLDRPQLSSTGGSVSNGTTVTLIPAAKAGSYVIYTLDGTDPRAAHGRISSVALSNLGPVTITITGNVRVVARSFNPTHSNMTGANVPPLSTPWSGSVAASFYTSVPPLRITEIMYHPAPPAPGNTNDQDNFEYLEVKNIGATPLNVNRFRLRGGLDFDFPNVTLAAGERAVIVRDIALFQSRYGNGPLILGVYTNDNLANDGDRLVLEGGVREPILDFNYDDDWYPSTDGHGFSLEIVNDAAATTTWGLKSSWRPSGQLNGTPGAADPGALAIPAVYVNEALTHTDPSPGDAIELFNSSASTADVGGWFLTDDFGTPNKFRIPDGTTIPAGGHRVFYQSNSFGLGTNGFALSSKGDEAYLFSAAANGTLTGWGHGFSFGPQANGVSFGRHVDSTGEDHFVAQSAVTLGSANAGPLVTVAISEINYHPPDAFNWLGAIDNSQDEYVELQNATGAPVPLYDPVNPANTWRLRDAVSYTFPPGVIIPAGGFVLVVGFDPADSTALAAFRLVHGVQESTPIYGPWSGQLDNSSDDVELTRPDLPDPPGTPSAGDVSQILVDKVDYKDSLPWPVGLPDGLGAVIGRVNVGAFGNDPGNWRTAPKTPGAPLPAGGAAPTIVTQPSSIVGVEGTTVTLSLVATGDGLGYIWTFNGRPVSGASSPNLTLTGLRNSQLGTYACYVFNSAGAVVSGNATLGIRYLPRITTQPVSRNVIIKPDTRAANLPDGTNVTFTVVATSFEPPITYQWRFNGVDIPGATSSSLLVTNVALEDEGDYYCVVTDGVAPVNSFTARLVPWIWPTFIQRPVDAVVAAGGTFSVSAIVEGNPPHFGFAWRRNLGSLSITNTVGQSNGATFHTFNTVGGAAPLPYVNGTVIRLTNFFTNEISGAVTTNFSFIAGTNWALRIIVTNEAYISPGLNTTFNVLVLADTDGDGVPDDLEISLGLNPNDNSDGGGDLDNDGVSNRAEFIAGTDLNNAASSLRVEASVSGGQANVELSGVAGRTYAVQFTDDLNSGVWTRLGDVAARTNSFIQVIPDPGWTTNRYYRAVTPRQ